MKVLLGITLLAAVMGALFSTKILADINKNIAAEREAQRPANVKILKITAANCADCFNLDSAIVGFKKLNVKVEEERTLAFDSPEASAAIKQFAIKKVPAYLVTGEINKNNLENFVKSNGEIKDKTFIFTKVSPVFIDTETGQETGRADLIYLADLSCADCYKASDVQKPILTKGYGVALRSERTVDISSVEGKSLLTQYGITKVPTILISPEADQYANLKNDWKSVGIIGSDGWYVFTGIKQLGNVIYKDLTNNQVIKPANISPNQTNK